MMGRLSEKGASVIPYDRSAWLKKLDEECPFQLTLPRRQLTGDSAIMDFLLSYAGKFDMYVEDECATYVRYCFADPLDAAIFRSRFEPKASHSGWRVEGAAELKSSRCGTTVVAPPGLRRPSQSELYRQIPREFDTGAAHHAAHPMPRK